MRKLPVRDGDGGLIVFLCLGRQSGLTVCRGLYSEGLAKGVLEISADGGGIGGFVPSSKSHSLIRLQSEGFCRPKLAFFKAEQLFLLLENHADGNFAVFEIASGFGVHRLETSAVEQGLYFVDY